MAVIAKISIGQFMPGDVLTGIDDARIDELIEAGFAEDIGLTADEEAAIDAEEARLEAEREAEAKAQVEAEQARQAEEAANQSAAEQAKKQAKDKAEPKPADKPAGE